MIKRTDLASIAHFAANEAMRQLARYGYSYSLNSIGLPYSIYDADGKGTEGMTNDCSLARTQDGIIVETVSEGLSWWSLRDEVAKLILEKLVSWNIDADE